MDNIKKINLINIEEIILAKSEIDAYLIESSKIEEKTTLEEFITNYITPNYIYIYSGEDSIPFGIYTYGDTKYIIYVYDNEQNKRIINMLFALLASIKYDMNNLHEVNNTYIMEHESIEHLISFNNKFFIP